MHEFLANGDLKDLMRRGLEAALAAFMEAEVSEQIGAAYGEQSAGRTTNRNGYRPRGSNTGLGSSTLQIPKVRKGTYFPSFLSAHKRSDDALVMAVAACYQQGVSTRKVEAIARALGVESLKKDQVSAMASALDPQVAKFRERKLGECPYVFLDARYEHVREDAQVHKVAVLVALGVRRDGHREVLGFAIERTENEAYWDGVLSSLTERGLTGVKLAVSDAHEGLRRAIEKRLPSARWQRCRVHFMRNLAQKVPQRQRSAFVALAKTIFVQESYEQAVQQRAAIAESFRRAKRADVADFLESADEVLTYMTFPSEHWTKLHSTNVVERLNRELKRRTRVVSIFPNRDALQRLVGALLLEEHEEWVVSRRYISEQSMKALYSPAEQLELAEDPTRHLMAAK